MTIPFRVKKLTETAKKPTRENPGDLWDLYADDFCFKNIHIKDDEHEGIVKIGKDYASWQKEIGLIFSNNGFTSLSKVKLLSGSRILVKTGISLELPKKYFDTFNKIKKWSYEPIKRKKGVVQCDSYKVFHPSQVETNENEDVVSYAVADIRPRSDALEQRGLFIENKVITGGEEVSFVAINHGHEPITINKGDKICQMLIRPLYPSKMEIVKDIEDTGRGGYGSTGK